jgi:hypothetical protein
MPVLLPVVVIVHQVAAAVQIIAIQLVELLVHLVLDAQVHVITGVNQPVNQLVVIPVEIWLLERYPI